MNKNYIIKKNEEIKKILDLNLKIVSKCFVLFYQENNLAYNRYCISISKKIGKAHTRNLYKRRIKDILMKNKCDNSKDYVIIIRKSILKENYCSIKNELLDIIKKEINK